jgi:Concanavalin A-like lectin/glucanases superfamily
MKTGKKNCLRGLACLTKFHGAGCLYRRHAWSAVLMLAAGLMATDRGWGQSCVSPPSGLVSWWPGEQSAIDIVGTNNGTLVGGVTFTNGKVGQAFSLNGTSQYVDVPDSPSLNPTNAVTCEAWVHPAAFSPSTAPPIIKKDGISYGGYALELGGPQSAIFGVYVSGNWYDTPYVPVPVNQWSHLTGVYDGTNASLYLNGVLAASIAVSGAIINGPGDLQIGHDPSNPTRYFGGLIDEPSVYNRALSSNEIQAIYVAGSSGKCKAVTEVSIAPYAGVTITGVTGGTYGVQYTTDLSNTNNWVGLTNLTLTGTNQIWYDSQPMTQPRRYYRVVPGPISIP